MKIENLEQLKELVHVCRKSGVQAIEVDGIKLSLTQPPKRTRNKNVVTNESSSIDTPDALSEEDLLFWSASSPIENL